MNDKKIKNLVRITQQKWADTVLEIGKAYKKKINLENLIFELLHNVYAFNHSKVLFKPTLAKYNQFRSTKEEFISYFLGQNKVCKEDKGFAIKNWKSIKFKTYKIIEYENYLLSMGNYYFYDDKNKSLKVEYTFGFIRINKDELRINLHHSSLPYND
ncbi:MAG: hypothetical protein CMM95_02800 [Rickettsiales bacterium]|nr:hypothetical protein [Rickettsiales bacterium]|tara:strand:- start:1586 stop:2056 length:471 start_codon:yes stop_codon:yes gene_type:complete